MGNKSISKVNSERRRSRYSREFKLEAVRLIERGQKPATQLALELGIRRNQLYKWRAQLKARGAQALRGPGRPRLSEESEVSRLRRELARVTEERDILKKAQAYFAKGRR